MSDGKLESLKNKALVLKNAINYHEQERSSYTKEGSAKGNFIASQHKAKRDELQQELNSVENEIYFLENSEENIVIISEEHRKHSQELENKKLILEKIRHDYEIGL